MWKFERRYRDFYNSAKTLKCLFKNSNLYSGNIRITKIPLHIWLQDKYKVVKWSHMLNGKCGNKKYCVYLPNDNFNDTLKDFRFSFMVEVIKIILYWTLFKL